MRAKSGESCTACSRPTLSVLRGIVREQEERPNETHSQGTANYFETSLHQDNALVRVSAHTAVAVL